jgi:hypothetical protein
MRQNDRLRYPEAQIRYFLHQVQTRLGTTVWVWWRRENTFNLPGIDPLKSSRCELPVAFLTDYQLLDWLTA